MQINSNACTKLTTNLSMVLLHSQLQKHTDNEPSPVKKREGYPFFHSKLKYVCKYGGWSMKDCFLLTSYCDLECKYKLHLHSKNLFVKNNLLSFKCKLVNLISV